MCFYFPAVPVSYPKSCCDQAIIAFSIEMVFFLFFRKKKEMKCERYNRQGGKRELNALLKSIPHVSL